MAYNGNCSGLCTVWANGVWPAPRMENDTRAAGGRAALADIEKPSTADARKTPTSPDRPIPALAKSYPRFCILNFMFLPRVSRSRGSPLQRGRHILRGRLIGQRSGPSSIQRAPASKHDILRSFCALLALCVHSFAPAERPWSYDFFEPARRRSIATSRPIGISQIGLSAAKRINQFWPEFPFGSDAHW